MPEKTHERELGEIQQTLTGFKSQVEDLRSENERERGRQTTRDDKLFNLVAEQRDLTHEVTKAVEKLAVSVEDDRKLTGANFAAMKELQDAKIKSIWRWLAGPSAGGLSLGAWSAMQKFFGGDG